MTDLPGYWFLISDPVKPLFYRTTAAVSIISNSLLIITIAKNKTIQMGNYRILLLCFAVGDMFSSLCHSWISPIVHLTESGFFFFPKRANDLKSENAILGKAVCLFYVFTYYETFNVLAFHFVYRYMVIVQGRLHKWTASWGRGRWFVAAIAFIIAHTTLVLGGFTSNPMTNEHSRSLDSSTFIDLYGMNTSDPTIGYVIIEFRRFNAETGLDEYDWSPVRHVYCEESTAKNALSRPSYSGVALGAIGNIIVMISTVFPSVDAIIIIYFIPAYRNSVKIWITNRIRPSDVVAVSGSQSNPSVKII